MKPSGSKWAAPGTKETGNSFDALEYQPAARTWMDLFQTVMILKMTFERSLPRDLPLTAPQASFLHFINQNSEVSPARLSEMMNVTRANVTGFINRLERGGFVTRERVKGDRRKVKLFLTEKSKEALERVMPIYGDRVNVLMKGFIGSKQLELQSLLRELRETVQQSSGEIFQGCSGKRKV